ncbi:MAG: hypothetical protein LBL94_00745, partial [Prevotellaceae bacterium]|nr:hypothetical protein [Prevotellaceae bacterium]
IEGFEYVVLSDMKEIIRRCKPIVQVEVWAENEDKILDLFNELKYTPFKLIDNQLVNDRGGVNSQSIDGDYIFIPDSKK